MTTVIKKWNTDGEYIKIATALTDGNITFNASCE